MDDDANDATVTPGKIWGQCALQGFVMMNINYCVWEHVHEAAWFIVSTHLSVLFTSFEPEPKSARSAAATKNKSSHPSSIIADPT